MCFVALRRYFTVKNAASCLNSLGDTLMSRSSIPDVTSPNSACVRALCQAELSYGVLRRGSVALMYLSLLE